MGAKQFLALLLISFLFASQLAIFQLIPTVKANTDWLTGWTYRKSHVINSASGAGQGYQVKIKAYYKKPPIESFTFVERTSGNVNAHQGVAWDGTYFYTTEGKTIYKYNENWELQASHDCSSEIPSEATQINSIFYRDGKLYIGANNWDNTPRKGWIVVYTTDLTYVETHQVQDHWCEGCAYHDGYWWVVYCGDSDAKIVSKYNSFMGGSIWCW